MKEARLRHSGDQFLPLRPKRLEPVGSAEDLEFAVCRGVAGTHERPISGAIAAARSRRRGSSAWLARNASRAARPGPLAIASLCIEHSGRQRVLERSVPVERFTTATLRSMHQRMASAMTVVIRL